MVSCWNACPSERPSFGELKKSFDCLLEEVSHYLDLNYKEPVMYIQHAKIENNRYDRC